MKDTVISCLREFRQTRDMTQQELADRSGVSRQSIISIEKGQYIPSLPLALKLSDIFNCSVKDLFQLKKK